MLGYLTSSEKDMEDGLNRLAKDTGGETFFNTNDLGGALTEALDSNRFYYVLGFYPPETEQGKGFQKFTRSKIRTQTARSSAQRFSGSTSSA